LNLLSGNASIISPSEGKSITNGTFQPDNSLWKKNCLKADSDFSVNLIVLFHKGENTSMG
jgi:hypothetical protein